MRERLGGWWPLGVVAVLVAAVGWLLYAVWQAQSHRDDLSIYGAFAVAMIALVVGPVNWAWQHAKASTTDGVASEEELNRAADLLATAVRKQWEAEAARRGLTGADPIQVTWGRPSQPMAGPASAAVSSRRFDPLPGLALAEELRLVAGDLKDMHALYGGLGSGRLVIAGPPGSGKTGTAVLLILAALRYRAQVPADDRPKIPVPVLVTAHSWDPRSQPVAAWLVRRLRESYPLFTGRAGAVAAAALIESGKITVIIDGLDESADDLRPAALQALDQQATFRIVILSRTAEIATASGQGVLHGAAAIELRPVSPAEAARYLERVQLDPPPTGWRDLIARIRSDPRGPLATALDNPLALSLVRDTYQAGDDARELLIFCGTLLPDMLPGAAAEAITDHLLDRVLPAAYSPRPGQPPSRYDLPTVTRTLSKIAARMTQDHTRDLRWWRIPTWLPRAPRVLAFGLTGALVGVLAFGLVGGLVGGLTYVLAGGITGFVGDLVGVLKLGLVGGLALGLVLGLAGPSEGSPRGLGRLRLRKVLSWENLRFGLVGGLVGGLVVGLMIGIGAGVDGGLAFGLEVGLGYGLGFGLVTGLALGLAGAVTADPDRSRSLSPVASWRADRNHGLVVGLVSGLVASLAAGGLVAGLVAGGLVAWPGFGFGSEFVAALVFGLLAGLEGGFLSGLVAWLVVSSARSSAVNASLASAQIAVQWHTPVRLMRFLDDACSRNVLRTVGPVYQFRHARLQDRLASAVAGTMTAADADDEEMALS